MGKGIGNGVTSWGQKGKPRDMASSPLSSSWWSTSSQFPSTRRRTGEEIIKPRGSAGLVVSPPLSLGYLAVIVPGMRILNGKGRRIGVDVNNNVEIHALDSGGACTERRINNRSTLVRL